ncbi:MAG: restriction endonuclease subunit S [Candidatus Humimicrobiaceae bacterium]
MQYSVVNYKTVKEKEDFRWDGEFLCCEPFKNGKYQYLPIGDILKLAQYGISIDMNENGRGYKIYRMNEISDMICNLDVDKYADINEKEMKKFVLKDNDVLFNRTNSQAFVGRTGIFKKFSNEPLIFASYLVRFRPDQDRVLPEYLNTFLNTKYGIQDVKRRARISINQSNVSASELKKVEIPLLSINFQIKMKPLFSEAFNLILNSRSLYSQAEQILLSELGLINWKSKQELAFVKNFSDTQKANRIDAEYFQPKYEEIVEFVKEYRGGFDKLGNLVKIEKSVEPGSESYQENGIPFVRVSNLSKFELSDNNQQFISEELYNELIIFQPKKGEILLSKDATPGIAYYLNEETQKMIVSGGILRLKTESEKIMPEYLTIVINSIIVQKQIERDAGGSIIKHWRPDQVEDSIIPILTEAIQKEIKELVEKSFKDRCLSKLLLKIAKLGVEIAIEKNEEEAGEWINNEIEKLGIKL